MWINIRKPVGHRPNVALHFLFNSGWHFGTGRKSLINWDGLGIGSLGFGPISKPDKLSDLTWTHHIASEGIFIKWKSNPTTALLVTLQRFHTAPQLALNPSPIRPGTIWPLLRANLTFTLFNPLRCRSRATSFSSANMPSSPHKGILRPEIILFNFSETPSLTTLGYLSSLTEPSIFRHSKNW